jgi:hypothetical protein
MAEPIPILVSRCLLGVPCRYHGREPATHCRIRRLLAGGRYVVTDVCPEVDAEHLGAICATDFFTVEVLTMTGIVRCFVLFVIDLKTRQVHIGGIAHQVYGKWVEQVARSLTDPLDGFLKDMRDLIHDRHPRSEASTPHRVGPLFAEASPVVRDSTLEGRGDDASAHAGTN